MSRFRSTFILHVITTLGLGIGYFSSVVLANYFGTTRVNDAYQLADMLFLILVVYVEPIREASVSRLKALEMDDPASANRSISAVINLFAALSVSLAVVTLLLIDPITRLLVGGSPDLFGQVRHIILFLPPLLIVQPLAALLEGYLYVQKRYYISQISKTIGLCVALAVLIVGQNHWGIVAYVAYRVVAFGIQLLGCVLALPGVGFRYSLTFRLAPGRKIATMVACLIVAEASMLGVVLLLRQALARDSGDLSAFGFAQRIWGAFLLILAVPISSVIWSDMIASLREARHKFWEQLHTPVRLMLTLLAGGGMVLICLAEPSIIVVFQRGKFDATSTATTTVCLRILAAGLPFWALMHVCTRGLVVLERTSTILWVKLAVSGAAGLAIVLAMEFYPKLTFAPVYAFVAGGCLMSLLLVRSVFAGAGRGHHCTYALYLTRIVAAAALCCLAFYLLGLDRLLIDALHAHGKWAGLAALAGSSIALLALYAGGLMLLGERAAIRYARDKAKELLLWLLR